MRLLPHAFIISSSKGQDIAEAIERILNRDKTVHAGTWLKEFKPTEGFMESLRRAALQYDFGIAVITPDDVTIIDRKTGKVHATEPRDNVVFELGLFSAALGSKFVIAVAVTVDGTAPSLPTDLAGINALEVTVDRKLDLDKQLENACNMIREHMIEHYERPDLGLLPSTALAIGYFENFVKPVREGLLEAKACLVGPDRKRREVVDWEMMVCIPKDLSKASREDWSSEVRRLGLASAMVDLPKESKLPRAYPFQVGVSDRQAVLRIFDTPTTLKAIYEAVKLLMPTASEAQRRIAHERGIADFWRALQYLLKDGKASNVKLTDWDDLPVRE